MHKTGYNEDEVLNTSCGSNAKLLQEERNRTWKASCSSPTDLKY